MFRLYLDVYRTGLQASRCDRVILATPLLVLMDAVASGRRYRSGARDPSLGPKSTGKKHKSNRGWLDRHTSDPYVKAAQDTKKSDVDLRSRSAFKLLEIHEKHRFIDFKRHRSFVDLGAAPGGWSVALSTKILPQPRLKAHLQWQYSIQAVDLLEMEPVPNVQMLKGDFRSAAVREMLVRRSAPATSTTTDPSQSQLPPAAVAAVAAGTVDSTAPTVQPQLAQRVFDVVLSDMLHNTTGQRDVDHHRSMEIAELVLLFCEKHVAPRGSLLCKFYQGADDQELVATARSLFRTVKLVKPKSSRSESREIYLLATERS